MKVELDDYSVRIIKEAEEITMTDYERNGNYIKLENLISLIEDLKCEIHVLEEQIKEREEDIRENYQQIPAWKQYGVPKYER